MAKPEERIYEGLAQVAHSIRRSTALNVASLICEPGTSIEQLLETADELAVWIRGSAGQPQTEDGVEDPPGRTPLGEPWRSVTGQD